MSLATLSGGANEISVTFEVSADKVRTWSDAKLSGKARWATHDVHLAPPVREFLGPGLSSLSLSVRLDAAHGLIVKDELANLRALRDLGQVVTFVVGGETIADFVLDGLAETWIRTDGQGAIMAAQVELSLEEYA